MVLRASIAKRGFSVRGTARECGISLTALASLLRADSSRPLPKMRWGLRLARDLNSWPLCRAFIAARLEHDGVAVSEELLDPLANDAWHSSRALVDVWKVDP